MEINFIIDPNSHTLLGFTLKVPTGDTYEFLLNGKKIN